MKAYHPESYWSDVAKRIDVRNEGVFMAGDDEPYYRYKRACFLKKLNAIDFKGKSVLEVGCGPGGNLLEVLKHHPKKLAGADLSEKMIILAKSHLHPAVEIIKSSPTSIPLGNHSFDIVFTATVLQHNTDTAMFNTLLNEIARISQHKIVLFERVEKTESGNELCVGRPISSFVDVLKDHGFKLIKAENLNIRFSYLMAGVTRKFFNKHAREEGEALSKTTLVLQNLLLPLTSRLDQWIRLKSDLTKLEFEKN